MSLKADLRRNVNQDYWNDVNNVDWRSKAENNMWDQILHPDNAWMFDAQEIDPNGLQRYNPTSYNPTGMQDYELKDLNLGRVGYDNLGSLPTLQRSNPNGYDAQQVGTLGSLNDMMSGQGLPQ